MKKLIILITILIVIACKEKQGGSIVGIQFKDYKELKKLDNLEKISDTSFFYDGEPKFRLLHLNNEKKELVIFASIYKDSANNRNHKVLDTLAFSNLHDQEKLTIGYCEIDLKNQNNGNLIVLVENTDSKNMFNTKIKNAWVANPNSEKIEQLKNVVKIECFNEWYDGKESKINYDLLND
jgi:nitrate reductase NapAB chaperone NapD